MVTAESGFAGLGKALVVGCGASRVAGFEVVTGQAGEQFE